MNHHDDLSTHDAQSEVITRNVAASEGRIVTTSITVNMPVELSEWLSDHAYELDTRVSTLVRSLILAYRVDQLNKSDTEEL